MVSHRALGQRIHVMGSSCSGKSTLGAELSELTGFPLVELDALNWQPNWVGLNATDPGALRQKIRDATAGDSWVLAGSYATFCRDTCWPRLQTMIWLDLPRWLLLLRVIRRSWKRWRTKEHLWGTNYESFFQQLKVWDREDSLIWWIWTQHEPKRRAMVSLMTHPHFAHIRMIRLRSTKEVREFRAAIGLD